MDTDEKKIEILKTLWGRDSEGNWVIRDLRGIHLAPKKDEIAEGDFFPIGGDVQLMTSRPSGLNIHAIFSSFGTSEFLVKQSIVPVIAVIPSLGIVRCIGTGFIISCTGLIFTAGHVLLDPLEKGYGGIKRSGDSYSFDDEVEFGVMIPTSPAYGVRGFRIFPFEWCCCWGKWVSSPLVHEDDRFELSADIAICKIPEMPNGEAHQPLNISLNSMECGERAYAIGYSEMEDIPIAGEGKDIRIDEFKSDLFASVGSIMSIYGDNHLTKAVPTPGPCFDFAARVPGKMSGGPIFGANGAVVRGVVSRSFSGEKHAFGSMLSSISELPIQNKGTLASLMASRFEGIPIINGAGI